MVSHYAVRESIKKLENTSHHEEQLYRILDVYMEIFPVLDAYLLRYSPFGYLAEGIIGINSSGLNHIRDVRDDVRSFPIVYTAIRSKKASYFSGLDFHLKHSSKYTFSSSVHSTLVVPICFGSIVVGYIISTKFEQDALFDDNLLSSLTLYGKLTGKALEVSHIAKDSVTLSKRELEVMQKIAQGESSKEMADSMNISELTVKQYVKTAIKKLGAHNRAQAVAELFRKGIIF